MTFAEFKAWIKLCTGNRSDVNTEIIQALNLAMIDLSGILKLVDEKGNSKNVVLDLPELDIRRVSTIETVVLDTVGTVAVTQNSTTVTGTGTLWSGRIRQYDIFTTDSGVTNYTVQAVSGDTGITLATAYTGATASGIGYRLSGFSDLLSLPADTVFIKSLFIRDKNKRLIRSSGHWIDDQGFAARGEPSHYVRIGTNLLLFPAPSQAFNMRLFMRRFPPLFTSSSLADSTTLIGLSWHEVLADMAAYKLLGLLKYYDEAEQIYRGRVYPAIIRKIGVVDAESTYEPAQGIMPHEDWITP
jgi:hypothetical protein